MNIAEVTAAIDDGTFEDKVKANAARRKAARLSQNTSTMQEGRDLYAAMYPTAKKEN